MNTLYIQTKIKNFNKKPTKTIKTMKTNKNKKKYKTVQKRI